MKKLLFLITLLISFNLLSAEKYVHCTLEKNGNTTFSCTKDTNNLDSPEITTLKISENFEIVARLIGQSIELKLISYNELFGTFSSSLTDYKKIQKASFEIFDGGKVTCYVSNMACIDNPGNNK